MNRLIRFLIGGVLSFGLLLVFGCERLNKQMPTAPEINQTPADESPSSLGKRSGFQWYSEKLIKAQTGGVINLSGGTRVVIPPDALYEDTVIGVGVRICNIWDLPDSDGEKPAIEFVFIPEGTQFKIPITLALSWRYLKLVESQDIALYYWNEEQQTWEIVEKVERDRHNRIITFKVEHFSRYAAAAIG